MTENGKKIPRDYMQIAYEEMLQSVDDLERDKTSPLVAAVLVFPDGHTQRAHRCHTRNGHHAEESLLDDMNPGTILDSAELYVTLEPCVPEARSPDKIACAERIVNARIKKVYIGMYDPNPKIFMKGVKYLLDHGVEVKMFDEDIKKKIEEANRTFSVQFGKHDIIDYNVIEDTILPELSKEAIDYYCDKTGINCSNGYGLFWDYLSDIGVLEKVNGEFRLIFEGYLAFGKDTIKYCDSAVTQVLIRFSPNTIFNPTGKEYEYREDFSGPEILVVNKISEWANKYLPKQQNRALTNTDIDYVVPFSLLKEAIVNAVVHRDYLKETGAFTQIYVSDNYLQISNPTSLKNTTIGELNSFTSRSNPINPKLARIFQGPHLMERSSSGMDTFSKASPKPMYEYSSGILSLKFSYSGKNALQILEADYGVLLTNKDYELFEFIRGRGSVSRKDVDKQFTIPANTSSYRLRRLMNLGLIERNGNNKSRDVYYSVAAPKAGEASRGD